MKTGLVVIIGLLLASEGVAQEKCKVEVRVKKGDKISSSEKTSSTGSFNMVMDEETNTIKFEENGIEVYVDEVLEVGDEGRATRVRRTVKKKRETKQGPGRPEPEETTDPLEGKTFVLSLEGGKTSYEEIPEGLGEEDLQGEDLLRPVFERFLPKGIIAVGHTWEIPEKDLVEEFEKDQDDEEGGMKLGSGKAVGTLKSIESGVAVVVYEVKMKGNAPNGLDANMKMTFTARIDSAKARLLSVSGKGKIKLSGSMDQGGNVMKVDGTFSVNMTETYTYE